ncbi:MAG TPA: glycosyltransferase family 2 protein [Patescibacteria group bacterium]|nr:glycosyltransferase family 2 protein [Patescibacteria group bacterium]
MPKVSVILVIYNAKKYIKRVFDAILSQTHKDLEIIAVINGSADGSKELIEQSYPQVKILEPPVNNWSASNNLAIMQSTGEFIQLVNQDLILAPDYIEQMLKAFEDKRVAAATGKLLRYDFDKMQKTNIIDTTGIVISNSGRARDRGQLQEDQGQFDNETEVFAVSGAGPMFRRSALEEIKYCENYKCEYMDEDFVMYWEDVDLSWRLNHCGYKCAYVPGAVGYHGRTAGQAEKGYLHLFKFIQHHQKLNKQILKWNYQNHIFMYLKNTRWPSVQFIFREIAMLGYILVFETSTLAVIPQILRFWPKMMRKRKYILSE